MARPTCRSSSTGPAASTSSEARLGLDNYIATRNWPTTGGITCIGAEGEVTYYKVYGSINYGTKPSRNATTGACEFAPSTDGTWQIHTATIVDYPSALNRCDACHADGWRPAAVDPTKGVAVTVDPGVAPFGNQLDDVLWGPTSASCMSCHQWGVPAVNFGWRSTRTARAGCPPPSRTVGRR